MIKNTVVYILAIISLVLAITQSFIFINSDRTKEVNKKDYVEYKVFDIIDYSKSKDEKHDIVIKRDVKLEPLEAMFFFKYFCNWVSMNEWSNSSEAILHITNWLETLNFRADIDERLPVWDCKVYIDMVYKKEWLNPDHLVDNFIINE